ncbi:variable surface lipoprotein [Mycoplasma bovis]|uniref:variable surface lipoprotein n=1 Tax=Mycoplasmopsis bovis TaxID=28903 RepID=UPI001BDE7EE7|nr:variable surface lipoprotein [Mycoplasmopsis bovis]MBT1369532.1 variable surface lipoprotein [Mycoplasmopsis bovis]MBT1421179.1 variable surface lipoprotein [Mycoplasmopsis bovis]MCA8839171.1 variable surface lipoprotein [Mycoplasmopsis bovis]MCA8840803.1 variable surface lipoprotein [Mycoplasmopsis bovis]MCA8853220.1 variable surface lipoprotein [Mycoplasmopsis bovis]
MKKINKIFITLASIVSISSLPIVAASCDVEKTEEGTGANSDTKDQEDQTLPKDQKEQTPQKDQSNQTLPKDQKEQTPQKDQSNQTPEKDQSNQTLPKDQKEQTPQKDRKDQKNQKEQTPQKDQSNQTPEKDQSNQTLPKDQKEQTPQKDRNTKKYRLPKLKEFLDKNDDKLFETDGENAKDELESLASEGALKIIDGKIQHHSSRSGKGKKRQKSMQRKSHGDVKHLKLNSKFAESDKVNTHGSGNKTNIGSNLGRRKKGIKISKEANKFVFEWQLYFEDDTKDEKIYKQEIVLN